jgi:hypothetical protein
VPPRGHRPEPLIGGDLGLRLLPIGGDPLAGLWLGRMHSSIPIRSGRSTRFDSGAGMSLIILLLRMSAT